MRRYLPLLLVPCLLAAEEKIDSTANQRIRQEEAERSQVMQLIHVITDRYGHRLTGSPTHEAAAKWAAQTMTGWGLKNARLEPWDFGHPGWMNDRASGVLLSPVKDNLTFEVLSWTPSTKGPVAAGLVQLIPPQGPAVETPAGAGAGRGQSSAAPQRQGPTKEELQAWMDANKGKVAGKIVLWGKAAVVPVNFNPPRMRNDDAQLKQQYNPDAAGGGRGGGQRQQTPAPNTGRLTANQVNELVDPWLAANGALVRVNDAGMTHGEIRAFHNRSYDVAKAVPTVVLRNEDFGRAERLLADGDDVKMEFNISNSLYPDGKTSYNVVAEIPGTDRPDEVVMLGGHLDSWHGATGATDNATGSAVMMEAVRLLQTLGLKPRRTIRVGLWSAEEQGLLGSAAYVKEHFGTYEAQKPDFQKFVAYLNVDAGTGRIRGANIFGPAEAAAALRAILAPFEDMGVMGANATRSRSTGGTDSTSFNAAGLAGVGLSQDPIEYNSVTWHTNLDTYERVVPEDVKQAATVVAAAVWHLATRDEALPKFTAETMPPPAAAAAAQPAPAPAPAAAPARP